jgi:hypothetical protein
MYGEDVCLTNVKIGRYIIPDSEARIRTQHDYIMRKYGSDEPPRDSIIIWMDFALYWLQDRRLLQGGGVSVPFQGGEILL